MPDLHTRFLLLTFMTLVAGCTFTVPRFSGIRTTGTSILASAQLAEFDRSPEAVQDLSLVRGREYAFVLNTVRENGKDCLYAFNRREAPVSVQITVTAEENLASDRTFPFEYVVPPNTDLCIARFYALEKKKDYRYRLNKLWMVGDFKARHNPSTGYRVPWPKGETFTVSQAAGGPITTHDDRFSRFALDFTMPVGTPVLAARAGKVVNFEDSFTVGALDRALLSKANFVDVLHDDGTIATYAHLAEKSIAVRLGQAVAAGEKLGLSGSTGYSSGPHLHFSVWRLESSWKGFDRAAIPVEFCFEDGSPCTALAYGMKVSAGGIRHAGSPQRNAGGMMRDPAATTH